MLDLSKTNPILQTVLVWLLLDILGEDLQLIDYLQRLARVRRMEEGQAERMA